MNRWPVRVHCGACGRVIARPAHASPDDVAAAETLDDLDRTSSHVFTSDGRTGAEGELPAARPEVEYAGVPTSQGRHVRLTLRCHPKRCGRTYELRDDRLAELFRRTQLSGRESVIVGQGRYATEHGGADI